MSNSYTSSSTYIELSLEQIEKARKTVTKVVSQLEHEDGYVGFEYEFDDGGLWFYDEESFQPVQALVLVENLVEDLKLDGIYMCEWAYTCDKPAIDQFGGGAFAVALGVDSVLTSSPD